MRPLLCLPRPSMSLPPPPVFASTRIAPPPPTALAHILCAHAPSLGRQRCVVHRVVRSSRCHTHVSFVQEPRFYEQILAQAVRTALGDVRRLPLPLQWGVCGNAKPPAGERNVRRESLPRRCARVAAEHPIESGNVCRCRVRRANRKQRYRTTSNATRASSRTREARASGGQRSTTWYAPQPATHR